MKSLVLYHAQCQDGFASAWVAHRIMGEDADYVPVQYGEPPPDVAGREVYVLDFSYPRDVMIGMAKRSESLVVLDHHKTAQANFADLTHDKVLTIANTVAPRFALWFDMDKSGARLAWEYFTDADPAPWMVEFVEDRDLWRWRLPQSREVSAALASYPWDFDVWDDLAEYPKVPTRLKTEGAAVLRYQEQQVESQCKNAVEIDLDGHKILSLNATLLISEIAGKLAEGRPFGATWFVRGSDGKKVWSLRSREGGIDVSEIARRHGGGGHRQAAGFVEAIA